MSESKIMDSEVSDVFSVGLTDRSAPASSKIACRIEGIDEAVITGSVIAYAATDLEEVFVFVGRRAVGRAAILWTKTESAPNREGRKGSFRFDLRFLAPDLLVEKKVKVEIRAQRAPVGALTKIEVETISLFPVERVGKEGGKLEGFIDGTEGGVVRGWVWDPTSAERRVKLHLFIDGVFCGIFEAAAPRPDLLATGRGDGGYGFVIPAEEFFARAGSESPRVELVSLEPERWRVPFASHAIARRRRPIRVPHLRRIPETVHEFAALLASSEPFPKKVYVLDRLKHKMPDAFSADYLLLGLEFLRVEMVKTGEAAPSTWSQQILVWWRRRLITRQIERLSALAKAAAASKTVLDTASRLQSNLVLSGERRERH